jgi:putative PIN family toxin of toxin-antitoxin system
MTLLAVLDTNIVLDLFVFGDPRVERLRDAIASSGVRWIATPAMRGELERVLAYPQVQRQLAARSGDAAQVLRRFDHAAGIVDQPATASIRCADPDDQMFVDLALAHRALLLSRDRELLRLRTRLAAHGVAVAQSLPEESRQPEPAVAA